MLTGTMHVGSHVPCLHLLLLATAWLVVHCGYPRLRHSATTTSLHRLASQFVQMSQCDVTVGAQVREFSSQVALADTRGGCAGDSEGAGRGKHAGPPHPLRERSRGAAQAAATLSHEAPAEPQPRCAAGAALLDAHLRDFRVQRPEVSLYPVSKTLHYFPSFGTCPIAE